MSSFWKRTRLHNRY